MLSRNFCKKNVWERISIIFTQCTTIILFSKTSVKATKRAKRISIDFTNFTWNMNMCRFQGFSHCWKLRELWFHDFFPISGRNLRSKGQLGLMIHVENKAKPTNFLKISQEIHTLTPEDQFKEQQIRILFKKREIRKKKEIL